MELEDIKNRLNMLDQKMDNMSFMLVNVAKAEEKIKHQENSLSLILSKLEAMDARQRTVEQTAHDNAYRLAGMYRFFWIMISTVTTALAGSIVFFNQHNP